MPYPLSPASLQIQPARAHAVPRPPSFFSLRCVGPGGCSEAQRVVPTEFRGGAALLGPDPPVGLWAGQCRRVCVCGGAQPAKHAAVCFLGKESAVLSRKESAVAVGTRETIC